MSIHRFRATPADAGEWARLHDDLFVIIRVLPKVRKIRFFCKGMGDAGAL